MEKMHIQTSAGFEWDMDPAVMDDILVIEDLAALDQGDRLEGAGGPAATAGGTR